MPKKLSRIHEENNKWKNERSGIREHIGISTPVAWKVTKFNRKTNDEGCKIKTELISDAHLDFVRGAEKCCVPEPH